VAGLPGDEEAAQLGRDLRADAVVELSWQDAEHTHAVVRVKRLRDIRSPASSESGRNVTEDRWLRREITFARSDVSTERGRTLGFAAASMVPVAASSRDAPPAVPMVDPFLSPAPPAPDKTRPLARLRPAWRGLFEAMATGTLGAAGEGAGFGGGLSAELALGHAFGARLGVEARTAQVSYVGASAFGLLAAPGVSWRPVQGRSFAVGGRLEGALGAYWLSRKGLSAPMEWAPGARALLDTAWLISDDAGFALAAGVEWPFRLVEVTEGGKTTSYYPLRLVVQLGLRAGF
jgi:hypothetical protein